MNESGQVSFTARLEEDKKDESSVAKFSAKALFQTKDRTGQSEVGESMLSTTHQNQVPYNQSHHFLF